MSSEKFPQEPPFLSIVAASRNDNHGGNLIERMQSFIDGIAQQSRKFRLPVELIIVEWNPPSDRPRLYDALRWPQNSDHLNIRIIHVPNERHMQFERAQNLPLFQMIAKNVGIRRSKGKFVLATNIDILFSDGVFEKIAAKSMKLSCLYRVDRYDTDFKISAEMSVDELLHECTKNIIRIHHRYEVEIIVKPQIPSIAQIQKRLIAIAKLIPRFRSQSEHLKDHLYLSLRDFGFPGPRRKWLHRTNPKSFARPHTMACGDFMLMSKADWTQLRGYPEIPGHGVHVDTLLIYAALASGITEIYWPDPVFHLEHPVTFGKEPTKEELLIPGVEHRIAADFSDEQFRVWQDEMVASKKPILFNSDWGLPDEVFQEILVSNYTK